LEAFVTLNKLSLQLSAIKEATLVKFRSGTHIKFNSTKSIKCTFAAGVIPGGRIGIENKRAHEQKREQICNCSCTDFLCFFFLLKWRKAEKELIYEKKREGSLTISESKLQVMLAQPVPNPLLTYISSLACMLEV